MIVLSLSPLHCRALALSIWLRPSLSRLGYSSMLDSSRCSINWHCKVSKHFSYHQIFWQNFSKYFHFIFQRNKWAYLWHQKRNKWAKILLKTWNKWIFSLLNITRCQARCPVLYMLICYYVFKKRYYVFEYTETCCFPALFFS